MQSRLCESKIYIYQLYKLKYYIIVTPHTKLQTTSFSKKKKVTNHQLPFHIANVIILDTGVAIDSHNSNFPIIIHRR